MLQCAVCLACMGGRYLWDFIAVSLMHIFKANVHYIACMVVLILLLYRLFSLVLCTHRRCGSSMGWKVESGGSGMVWILQSIAVRRM